MILGGLGARFLSLAPIPLPMVVSIETDTTGNYIYVAFNKIMFTGAPNVNELNFEIEGSATGGTPNTDNVVSWSAPDVLRIEVIGLLDAADVLTLTYTPGTPGSDEIRDPLGNALPAFTDEPVTNLIEVLDTTAPQALTFEVDASGDVVVTCDEALNESSGDPADFTLDAPSGVTFTGIAIAGDTITLTPSRPIYPGETVTLDHTPGGSAVTDVAGNDLEAFSNQSVTNNSALVLEQAFAIFISNGTQTDHAVGTSITFDGFGAGGGGARPTGDVGQNASGGGGEHSRVTKTSAEASYTIATGTGGATGLDNLAIDGTDTTVSDTSGVILRAKGGLKGVAANPTGTAGLGGTGGVGDSLHAGGDGNTGAAGTNGAGGGSGGSSTAASGLTPGDPDGSAGNNTSNDATRGAGGCRRANSAARPGGGGWVTSWHARVLPANYPYIPVGGLSQWRDTSNLTSRGLTVPGTHVANDRLLVLAGIDGAGGLSSMTGLTELVDAANSGGDAALGVYTLDATGSDSLTLATASEQTNGVVLRIRNAAAVATWDLTGAQINTAQMDAPSHTHAGGSKPILWIAVCAYDGNTPEHITAFPSGFDRTLILRPRAYGNASPGLVVAMKVATAATQDPGAWASVNRLGYAATIAIPLLGA